MKNIFFIIIGLMVINQSYAQKSWDGGAGTNNWSDGANWLPDGVPITSDDVTIGSGFSINVNVNAQCNNLSFLGIAANTSVSLNPGITLDVTGTITFVDPTAASSQTVAAGDGVLTCGAVLMANTSGFTETNNLTLNNGSITVNGNITTGGGAAANENYVIITGNGTLNLGGSFAVGTFTISGTGSTVRWFGDNTNFRSGAGYYNLIIQIPASAGANRTRQVTSATTVGGNLTIESLHPANFSILDANNQDFIVNGTTTINARGRFYDGINAGTNTFIGNVLIQANGEFTNTNNNSPFVFQNGINNNGIFTLAGSGAVTFSTNTQTIQGTQPLTLGNGAVNINGAITVTNNTTVTINGVLDGNNASSLWINGNSSVLNYSSGTRPFNTNGAWDVNTNANTVNYNGGNQNIRSGDYSNLTFSNNNTKTLTGITNVNQLFTVSGTTSIACGANNFNLLGGVAYTGTGTITTGVNTVTYNSTAAQDIVPGTYSGNLTLQASGNKTLKGTTTVTGTYTQDANLDCGVNNFTLNGTVTHTLGTLTCGANTVTYGGTVAQTIISATYNNLSLTGAGSAKSLEGTTGVNGAFVINTGSLSCGTNNFTLSGTVTHTAGIFSTGANVVTYNGVVAQNVLYGTYSGDVQTSGGAKTLSGATITNGSFTMAADLSEGVQNLSFTGPVNYTSGTFSSTGGTTTYSGAAAQNIITGSIGGALTISGGNKTLVAAATPLTVAGTSTLNTNINTGTNNVIFNGNVTMNGNITAGTGNLTFNGQQTYTSGVFTTGNNTVTYGGAAAQNVIGGTYGGNLTLSGAGAKTLVATTAAVGGAFSMASSLACGTNNLALNGAVSYTSGTLTTGANTVTYGRTSDQDVIGAVYSGNLVFSGSGNRNILANSTATNALTIPNNITLNLNGLTLLTSNNITIDLGGQLNVLSTGSASASLRLANTRILTNNGTFRVIGNVTYPAIITQNGAGTYSIIQATALAAFHANYYQFNYLNGGINITNGSIDPTNNFSNGSFSNGTGPQSLMINNIDVSGLSNIANVTFNAGPTYNVTRTAGTGALNFIDASGTFSGENFDNDNGNPGTLILWNYPATTYYSNPLGTFSAGLVTNWTRNPDGTGGNPASVTDGLTTLLIQNGHTVTVDAAGGNINVKELQIGQGASGALIIGNNATQRTVTIQHKLDIRSGASLTVGSAGSSTHILQIYGNIINQGTLNLGAGNVANTEIYGTTSAIMGPNTPVFNDITFKTNANATAYVPFDVRGNVVIENTSTFNDGDLNHTVKGNWSETGTGQRTGNGTITFNGFVNTINNAAGTAVLFNNVIFNGAGAGSIQENITVNGSFTVTNNTALVINNYSNTVLGNFTIDAGSSYNQTANTTNFNGASAQTIAANGTVTFNNISFNNGGVNAKTTTGTIIANGLATISSGSTVDGTANFSIAGGLRLDGFCNWSGNLTFTGGTINTANASNTATLGTAAIFIAGNVVLGYAVPATSMQLNVFNNVTIQSGYLVVSTGTTLVGQAGNTLNVGAGTNLYLRGNDNFPTGFDTYILSPTSIVRYDWNLNQVVRGNITYGNVILDDNGSASAWIKTADGPLNLAGYLDLNGAITLSLGNNPLTVSGYIYNATNSSIDGPLSTVTLNAPDAQQIVEPSGTGFYTFRDLIITLDAATAPWTKYIQAGANLSVLRDFTITNNGGSLAITHIVDIANNDLGGTPVNFNLGAYCQLNTTNVNFGTNVIDRFTGTKTLNSTSTVYYSLNGAQNIADGFTYGNISFNGGNKTAEGPLDINGSIKVGGGTPVFIDGGFTHTVAGNWSLGTGNYTLASATGTIVLDGIDQDVAATNFNHLVVGNTGTATLNGALNLYGNFTINNDGSFDANIQNINIDGNWNIPGNGVFTQSTGTTTFDGAANQTITTNTLSNFYNLTINKPNAAGNQTVTVLSDMVVKNNTTITTNAGILDITGQNIRFGGRLYVYANAIEPGYTFIANGSNVTFDGSVLQYIYNNNTNPLTFNNIEFSGAGDKFFEWGTAPASRIVDINGNILINGCTLNGNGWGNGGVDLFVAGDWTNTGTFTHVAGRTVTFDGANQAISSTTFGSVNFAGTATKTLTGNITLSGNLTISDGSTLDPNSNNITLAGIWDNSSPTGQFNSTTGTVIFEGNSYNITTGTVAGPAVGKGFNNIIVNKNAGNVAVMAGDLDVHGDLTINGGWLRTQTYDMWVGGNFINNGTFDHNNNNSILTLNASGGNLLFNPGASNTNFRGVHVNAPGTTYTVQNNFTINQNQDFIIDDGYFDLQGHTLFVVSNNQRIILNNGTLDVDPGAVISFSNANQSLLNNGGVLRVVGLSTNIATITRTGGTYTITQTGGTMHASNYKFDLLNGITINGGFIDPTNNFSDGTFGGGAGTAYLILTGLNFGDFTASNVVFNSGPTYNVARTSGTGTITFADATGALSGESFDNDNGNPGTLINWTSPGGFYWTRGAGTDNWNDPGNWLSGTVPDGASNVYLNHQYYAAAYTVRITTVNANAGRVIMDAQAGAAITLQLENGYDLDVNGSIVIGSSTTVNVTNANSTINVAGNWSNQGTGIFNHGNSTVTFDGMPGSYTIATGGNGATKKFYNLSINAAGATYALSQTLDVDNNVNINAGTFNLGSPNNDITVGGNWLINSLNGAIFVHNQADVSFDGTNQSISGGPFFNFITANSGTKQLTSNVDIDGTVTIGVGTTLDAQSNGLYVARNWTNNGSFTQNGLGTITFNGTIAQQIDNGSASTTYNYLVLSNAGGKTFNRSASINGDFNINTGSGTVNVNTFQLTGNGSNVFIVGDNVTFQVRGADNFPNNFGSVNLSNTSIIDYISDVDPQTIRKTAGWSYGHLRLSDLTAPTGSVKVVPSGDLAITGNLYINDIRTTLDMATNSANMILTGTIVMPTGGQQINWGAGTSTLTQIGDVDWGIDADITGFNNLILAGSGNKYINSDLTITGNVIVRNNVGLVMYNSYNNNFPHVITGNAGKTFTLENGSRFYNSTPSATAVAFPTGFSTYAIAENSTVTLNSPNGVNQTLFTGNGITYGNLNFNNTKDVTSDGVATLDVNGSLNMNTATYFDNGRNINVAGADIYLNYYTPSSSSITFTLDGNISQYIRDAYTGAGNTNLDFGNIVFSGTGTKTLGDGNDAIIIAGNLQIANLVTVTSNRNIAFNGQNWTNNGIFNHTANTVTFDRATNQTIDPGPANASNYFYNVLFSNTNAKTFTNHGADINGVFTITSGTVNLGALSHNLAGTVTNNTGGILNSASANITFYGGNQNINTPAFAVNNVIIANNGTKRLFSNWTINGDLTINNGSALNTSDGGGPATISDIFIHGNWINNGTFTCNTSRVTFNGSTSPINITSNNSNFYNVEFIPGAAVQYYLQSPSTRFSRAMDLRSNATLNLNSKSLILGSNIAAGKVYTIEGTLNINENALLRFNNQTSQSVMNVSGTLRLLGVDNTNTATISREGAGVTGAETQINILAGGTIAARYYLIEYLQDAGLNVQTGAILDPVNNFSDGTWSNIRNVANVCYLNLEASVYTGGDISNICFNYTGTPTQGQHFNVRRNVSNPNITFSLVTGNLGNYRYEDDEEALPSANSGRLQWPAITLTNWTGAVNTDWHVAGNWDNGIPTGLIDAVIPDRPNDPHILATDATCKNLQITNGTLVVDNGYDLVTSGDVTIGTGASNAILGVSNSASEITVGGLWTRGANGMFIHGGGTVRFVSSAGTSTITPLTSNFNNVVFDNPLTTFYIAGANITFKGTVDITNGTVVPTTNNYNYSVEGDFIVGSGQFTPTAGGVINGMVTFSGAANQNITNASFHNLTISGSGTKATHNNITIANVTTINSTLKAESGSTIDFNGNVTINGTGTFDDGGETHTFSGATWTGTGAYTGTGTIKFDRTGAQTIAASKFNNLDINCNTASLTLTGNVTVTGDVTVRNGVTNLFLNTLLLNNSSGTGKFEVENTTQVYITGYDVFPSGFNQYMLSPNSTVRYQGGANQLVSGVNYGSLNLINNNIKTLKGDIGVQSALTFNNSTLDVSVNNYNITVTGAWNNNTTGTFLGHTGEVVFDGGANQNITISNTATNIFYDVTLNKSAGTASLAGTSADYTIQNNLNVISGTFSANGRTVNVANNFTATGGTFANSGTFILNKPAGTANIQTNGSALNNLTINSAGGATFLVADNLTLTGNLNITAGTFDGNGKYISSGNWGDVINISGTYRTGAGGTLAIGANSSLTVNSGGTFEAIGAPGSVSTITRNILGGAGTYSFLVNGTIRARYALFEFMNTGGIYINSGGTIDAVNNFSYCTFTNGTNAGPMLRIENTQSFTGVNAIMDVTFPTNPGGSSYNARKITGVSGTIEFYNAAGVYAGETFDDDPFNLINWTGPVTLTWNGSVNSDWFVANNWTASSGPYIVPTGAENVIIPPTVNQPVITTFGAISGHLTIQNGATLILDTPNDGGNVDLDINGDITINTGGTFRMNTVNDYLTIEGNWTKSAGGTSVINGNITFDGVGLSKTINNGISSFYNLTIAGNSLYKISSGSVIRNDISINAGANLEMGTNPFTLSVGGNWYNGGNFNSQTGTVNFNALSGTKTIFAGSSSFNNITFNASASYNLTSDIRVNGNLNIITGTLSLNGRTCYMGNGVGLDYLTINGILNMGVNANLRMGNNAYIQVNSGGTLNVIGTDINNLANITNQGAGNYSFEIKSGGTLAARYYNIGYTNSNGIYFNAGALLHATNNLSDGTFSNGAAGGSYLRFENDFGGDITIANVVFNPGPQYNVTRISGTDVVTFRDASGDLGTYLNENDLSGIVDPNLGLLFWTYLNTYVWTGAIDHDWHTGGNWMSGLVPDITKFVVIPDVVNDPIISNNVAFARKITIYTDAILTLNNRDLTTAEDVSNNGTITITGNPVFAVGGNWGSATGTLNAGNSRIVFNSLSGNKIITIGTGNFYDVDINAGAGVNYQFSAAPTIQRNLSIISGILNGSTVNITVGGSWTNTGSFLPGVRTVTLNGASGVIPVNPGVGTFYNLIINSGNGTGNATYTLSSNLSVTNNFTLTKGTFDLSPDGGVTSYNSTVGNRQSISGGTMMGRASTISVGENWTVSGSGNFTCGTSTVILAAVSSTRNITPGSSPFYNLTVNSGGTYRITNNTIVNKNLSISAGSLDVSASPSYNISIGGNWANNGSFLPRAGNVIFNGTTQSISHVAGETFYNLTLTNNTQVSLSSGNITATNGFTFTSGTITTGIYRVILGSGLGNSGTLSYTSGRVIGQFERWVNATGTDYLFPIGTATSYNPSTLRFINGFSGGSVRTEFSATDPGSTGLPLSENGIEVSSQFTEGYWNITPQNGMACTNYNLTLLANGFTSHVINSDSRILKRTNGGSWTLDGTHVNASTPICYRDGLNGLSVLGNQFCIGDMECLGGQIGSVQSLCSGDDVAPFSSLNNARGGSGGFTYTWQFSTNASAIPGDGNWTDIPSSNTPGYDYGTLSQTTYFLRKASSPGCVSLKYSNILNVTVNPLPSTGPVYRRPNN